MRSKNLWVMDRVLNLDDVGRENIGQNTEGVYFARDRPFSMVYKS